MYISITLLSDKLNDCLFQNICSLEIETLNFYVCHENTK